MWMWRSLLCVSLVCGLTLDSNTIRSSERQGRFHGDQTQRETRGRTETSVTPSCFARDCDVPERGRCSNRAQRKPSRQDGQVDTETDTHAHTDRLNRTKAGEMSSCVRSGDCEAGLCCARYLTGNRCQRVPQEGDACLLRGSAKLRRNLGRCSCAPGLSCSATRRPESGSGKGQGVCVHRPRQVRRKTRHSGKRRQTAERSC